MQTTVMTIAGLLALCQLAGAQDATVQLAESFRSAYVGDDATGEHVIALWQFGEDAPEADASSNGHHLTLQGGEYVADGKFGGGLECFRGWPVEDKPHRAFTKNAPKLTPRGAFTVEMWIKPKPELEDYPESFLLDNRYVDDSGLQLILGRASGAGRRLVMNLGFGAHTQAYSSAPIVYEAGVWRHIAFTYDGAGTGRFVVDGAETGSAHHTGLASIAPAKKNLHIGDRVGSYYHGFPGFIDQVRMCSGVLEFRPVAFEVASQRRVFVRMEEPAIVKFGVTNKLRSAMTDATARLSLGAMPALEIPLPTLESGGRHVIDYQLDSSLRPDTYQLSAAVEVPGENAHRSTAEFAITIIPRPLPRRMPVVMWGAGLGEVERLKDIGFTHAIGLSAGMTEIWDAGEPTQAASDEGVAKKMAEMDEALASGIGVVAALSPGRWARRKEEFCRVNREGEPQGKDPDVCGLSPEVQSFCYNVGASVAQTYGEHPALQAALVHTEVRGHSELCFHQRDKDAFREFAGFDIPEEAMRKRGVSHRDIAGFPTDRVIPDDYPLYVYYLWFWHEGDGWNALHTAVHEGLKSTGRDDLWTFHDPAARVASAYGNGGDVDFLSHWTYSYPDPIRIGLCADELFCMAGGARRGDQRVMKMTQIIWYRNQTAPQPGEEARVQDGAFVDHDVRPQGTGTVDETGRYRAAWEREMPGARFITIAPMHLREAFWAKIARPIQGIMYHGWQSLVDVPGSTSAYQHTHPETKHELRRLVKTVVEPLGPTLMQVPDRKGDVGFLESFASQMFAQRGTYGWNGGWGGDAYEILHYAQLQPRVIYDDTVLAEGFDEFKVLVLADCDVLIQSVVERIKAFQDRGGIIIGDDKLCPAIQPDILVPSMSRPKEADMARAGLMEAAENLRAELDPHYVRHAQASEPSVITRVRQYGSTDYLFVINDLREFGDYVGHHGLVMENGLPIKASVNVARSGVNVYDLVAHREIEAHGGGDSIDIDLELGPCEGRVLMVTEEAIAGIEVEAPESVMPGGEVSIKVTVVDENGAPLDAVVPVKVDVLDPHGRAAEFSGFYGAKDGRLAITAVIAANDVLGVWRIRVRELASGRVGNAYVSVAPR